MTLPTLAHHLDRSVFILAKPDTVFAYFQDSARWASWWGAGSTIDPRPGGKVYIRYPNNVEALGEVVEIAAPSRIVFTFGYASGTPMGPGESRVTIALAREGAGTRLTLTHEVGDASSRDQHVQGWRFHLSVFANVIANALHADVNARVIPIDELAIHPDLRCGLHGSPLVRREPEKLYPGSEIEAARASESRSRSSGDSMAMCECVPAPTHTTS